MKLKKMMMVVTFSLVLVLGMGITAQAKAFDEANAIGGWSEQDSSIQMGNKTFKAPVARAMAYEPQYVLRNTQSHTFSNGVITLKSYTMELLNDTKLCKGVTSHSNYMYGYVRARFETIFGEPHTESDSGRVYSYYGGTAETPDSESGGWNGIAHTYCGA